MDRPSERVALIEFYARRYAVARANQATAQLKAQRATDGQLHGPGVPSPEESRANARVKRVSQLAERDGIPLDEIEEFADILEVERDLLASRIAEKLDRPRHAD